MKRVFYLLCFQLLIVPLGFAQVKKINDMIGRWNIAGEQNAGAYLEVIDSSTIMLSYQGQTRLFSDVKLDCSKSPCWFDFSTRDTSSMIRVKSLLEVVGNQVMKWQLFIDEERPAYFTAKKGELLYLKRSKESTDPTARNE